MWVNVCVSNVAMYGNPEQKTRYNVHGANRTNGKIMESKKRGKNDSVSKVYCKKEVDKCPDRP